MSPLVARPHRVTVIIALALLTLLALLIAPSPAVAHTELVGSTPAAGARVASAPNQVELVFSEDVTPDLAAVALSVGGSQIGRLPVSAGGSTDTLLVDSFDVAVQDGAGATPWRVRYRVTSVDGHPIEGSVEFTVAGAQRNSPTPPAAAVSASPALPEIGVGAGPTDAAPKVTVVSQESSTGIPIAAALVVVVLALPLLLVVAVRRLRSRRVPSEGTA
ncbi:copper resistance CopC family protein [Nocardioides kribbensis]|uniref:Copper resistance CopC family protein n=1 Tax=Nocardioides kribbensis TaxID=305517 RepID=A0ABV1NT80_9ACTN